jgi:hypothetical protein
VKEIPADRDISSGRVLRAFSWNGEAFGPNRHLMADEVLAIPIADRRALVEGGYLQIYAHQRPGWRPESAKVSADDNAWLEALAITEIERLPTRAWESMLIALSAAWPSTRKRALMHMVNVAADRGDPLPPKVLRRLARALAISPKARNRIQHSTEALRAAALYKAENPSASWGALARAAGVSRHTVRGWPNNPEFQRLVKECKQRPRRPDALKNRPAYGELLVKAAELRKREPHLTKEQAFAKVYTDPANREMVERERRESAPPIPPGRSRKRR